MNLTTTPQDRLSPLHYAKVGDVLIVNGRPHDFGQIAEGDVLPRDTVPGDWLCSDVTRTQGVLRLTVVAPNAASAPANDGKPVALDWTRLVPAHERATRTRADWRASASMPRSDFALACFKAGLLTEAEATAVGTGDSLPAWTLAAVDALPENERPSARIRIKTSPRVHRSEALVEILRQARGLTAAQVDALFPGAPA